MASVVDTPVIEQISSSVTIEWLDNRSLPYVIVKDATRPTIDSLEQVMTPIVLNWSAERRHKVIYDFTDPRVKPTPYSNAVARKLIALRHDFPKTARTGGLTGRTRLAPVNGG